MSYPLCRYAHRHVATSLKVILRFIKFMAFRLLFCLLFCLVPIIALSSVEHPVCVCRCCDIQQGKQKDCTSPNSTVTVSSCDQCRSSCADEFEQCSHPSSDVDAHCIVRDALSTKIMICMILFLLISMIFIACLRHHVPFFAKLTSHGTEYHPVNDYARRYK